MTVTLKADDFVPVAEQLRLTRVPPLAEPLHWVIVALVVVAGNGSPSCSRSRRPSRRKVHGRIGRRFPVGILKIDREFTDGADSPDELRLFRGIVQLGRLIGLDLVAEGIERAEQIGPIVEAGSEQGQGYLLARPMDADALTALLGGGPVIHSVRRIGLT